MTDHELELALLDRYLVQHKLGEQEDPDRRDKCSRELDLRKLLSELSGKEGADLDYDAQVWLKRLTKPRQGDMPGPLRQCSNGSKNGSTHKFHLRAFSDDTGLPAADRAQELRDKLGVSAEFKTEQPSRGHRTRWRAERTFRCFHPDISGVARDRFEAGQYADAVEASLKEVDGKG